VVWYTGRGISGGEFPAQTCPVVGVEVSGRKDGAEKPGRPGLEIGPNRGAENRCGCFQTPKLVGVVLSAWAGRPGKPAGFEARRGGGGVAVSVVSLESWQSICNQGSSAGVMT
jgi:hypothetical protein